MRREASENSYAQNQLKPYSYGSRNVLISGKHQSGLLWRGKPINLLVFYLSKLLLDVLKSNSKTLKTFITIKQIPQSTYFLTTQAQLLTIKFPMALIASQIICSMALAHNTTCLWFVLILSSSFSPIDKIQVVFTRHRLYSKNLGTSEIQIPTSN